MAIRANSADMLPEKKNRQSYTDLLLHIHPRKVPEQTIRLTHTWGLGGMAALMVLLQVLTGILLLFVYQPISLTAYDSVLALQNDILFGRFIRNIHHWSANLLVVIVLLHMLRVFFSGAFHPPRRFNWIIGLCLFGFVFTSNFTGYLLPWDQLAYWAVTIVTGMLDYVPWMGSQLQQFVRGGIEVGPATLSNFFVCHVIIMPVCFMIFMPFHFWRIRKAGGVVLPRAFGSEVPSKQLVPTQPNLIVRELAVGVALVAFILILSALFDAPLENQANPGLSPNPTKPPWYFAGFQELLLHFHPLFAVAVIPGMMLGGLVLIPYLKYDEDTAGIWFCSPTGLKTILISVAIGCVIIPLAVITDEQIIARADWLRAIPNIIHRGVIPLAIISFALIGMFLMMRWKYKASINETVQSVLTLLLTAFAVLTVIGVWFRGAGMKLGW
jgi:quinol-cytochrome oxidoreductase complex cytochrome b subunit